MQLVSAEIIGLDTERDYVPRDVSKFERVQRKPVTISFRSFLKRLADKTGTQPMLQVVASPARKTAARFSVLGLQQRQKSAGQRLLGPLGTVRIPPS